MIPPPKYKSDEKKTHFYSNVLQKMPLSQTKTT